MYLNNETLHFEYIVLPVVACEVILHIGYPVVAEP